MPRPKDECLAISVGKLASAASVCSRKAKGVALQLAVAEAGMDLVSPRVRPRAIFRVLARIAPSLDPKSPEALSVLAVLKRTHRAYGIYCSRNPRWVAAQVAEAAAKRSTNP